MPTEDAAARPARLLVAIPTLNEARHIERVLSDLLAGTADLPDARIAVVDGGSTDGTTDIVEAHRPRAPARLVVAQPRAHSKRGDQPGRAHARPRHGRADPLRRAFILSARLLPRVCSQRSTGSMPTPSSSPWTRTARAACSARSPGSRTRRSAPAAQPIARAGAAASWIMATTPRFEWTAFVAPAATTRPSATTRTPSSIAGSARSARASTWTPRSASVIEPRATLRDLWRQYFRYGAGRSRTARRHPGSLRLRQLAVPAHLVLSLLALARQPIVPRGAGLARVLSRRAGRHVDRARGPPPRRRAVSGPGRRPRSCTRPGRADSCRG